MGKGKYLEGDLNRCYAGYIRDALSARGDWRTGSPGRFAEQIVNSIMDVEVVRESRTARVTWIKISNTGGLEEVGGYRQHPRLGFRVLEVRFHGV